MNDKCFIFIGGLHRSGTSLLHEILRSHPAISGFTNTGVPKDEGQHLQSVFQPASAFGGPGRFGFNDASYMTETHPLAVPENSGRLFQEWQRYWDITQEYLLEKSPPNLIRTRFLQQLFPNSKFIIILRHPIAVAYATKKRVQRSIPDLIAHALHCYERFRADMAYLNSVYVMRYEELVFAPQENIERLLSWIGLPPLVIKNEVLPNINQKYLALWRTDRLNGNLNGIPENFEKSANVFGYSLKSPDNLLPIEWLGANDQQR